MATNRNNCMSVGYERINRLDPRRPVTACSFFALVGVAHKSVAVSNAAAVEPGLKIEKKLFPLFPLNCGGSDTQGPVYINASYDTQRPVVSLYVEDLSRLFYRRNGPGLHIFYFFSGPDSCCL